MLSRHRTVVLAFAWTILSVFTFTPNSFAQLVPANQDFSSYGSANPISVKRVSIPPFGTPNFVYSMVSPIGFTGGAMFLGNSQGLFRPSNKAIFFNYTTGAVIPGTAGTGPGDYRLHFSNDDTTDKIGNFRIRSLYLAIGAGKTADVMISGYRAGQVMSQAVIYGLSSNASIMSSSATDLSYNGSDAYSGVDISFGTNWEFLDGIDIYINDKSIPVSIDDLVFDSPSNYSPATQCSSLGFSTTTGISSNINWTRGSGDYNAVFVSQASSGTAAPVTGTTYTANNNFGSGTQIGSSGWYCIYNGKGTSTNVTGLTPGTTYRVMTVSYNGNVGYQTFNTSATTNVANVTTIPIPATQASQTTVTVNYTNFKNVNINWTNGDGNKRAVFVRNNTVTSSAFPPLVNSITYTAAPGTDSVAVGVAGSTAASPTPRVGSSGWYCVYNGTGSSVNVSRITVAPDQQFKVMVVEYNGAAGSETYNLNTVATNPVDYLGAGRPVPVTVAATNVTATTAILKGTIDPKNGNISAQSFTYSVNADLSAGITTTSVTPAFMPGNNPAYVVSSIITGLTPGTTYYYRLSTANNAGAVDASNILSFTTVAIPTVQASSITVTPDYTDFKKVTINWTNGNGAGRAVFVRNNTSTSSLTAAPVHNTTYTAFTDSSLMAPVSTGRIGTSEWYCVYNGTDPLVNSVNVTGITTAPGQQLRIMVVEYNGVAGSEAYNTSTNSNNPVDYSVADKPLPVTAAASNLTSLSATLNGTIDPRKGDITAQSFTWSTNSDLSAGTTTTLVTPGSIAGGDAVTSVNSNITGLTPGTTYYYRLSASNNAGAADAANILSFTAANIPVVNTVSSTTADGNYKAGSTIQLTVTFNDIVIVTGTPILNLNTGGTAAYVSGSGTNTLIFTYVVTAGENSSDLDYSTVTSLNLSGGTIKDIHGANASINLPTVGGSNSIGGQKNIVIDTRVPLLTSVSIQSNNANTALAKVNDLVTLSFTADEVISMPVVLIAGNPATTTNTGGNNWTASRIMQSTDATGVITFSINFSDLATNAGTVITSSTNSSVVAFDKTLPQVQSIVRLTPSTPIVNVTSVVYRVTFSEQVSNVTTAAFALTTTGTSNGIISSVSVNTGTSIDVTVNSVTSGGTIRLDITNTGANSIHDAAGNTVSGAYTAGEIYTINTSPVFTTTGSPTVSVCRNTGIAVQDLLRITDNDNGQTLTWTVLTAPLHGTLTGLPYTNTSNGSAITPAAISYSSAANYSGADVFTVRVSDGLANADITIQVNVQSVIPTVSIAASPGVTVSINNLVTFTATGTSGGSAPIYSFKVNGVVVQSGSASTYSSTSIKNGDMVSCTMTSNAGCATTTQVNSNVLLMAVLQQTNIFIYPNPAKNDIVHLSSRTRLQSITIVSATGKTVYNEMLNNITHLDINTSTWGTGVYFLITKDVNGNVERRTRLVVAR